MNLLRAEVWVPLWLPYWHWQAGQFQGEDASSPVLARYYLTGTHLTGYAGATRLRTS